MGSRSGVAGLARVAWASRVALGAAALALRATKPFARCCVEYDVNEPIKFNPPNGIPGWFINADGPFFLFFDFVTGKPKCLMLTSPSFDEVDAFAVHQEWMNEVGRLLTDRPMAERYARFVAWTKRHHDA